MDTYEDWATEIRVFDLLDRDYRNAVIAEEPRSIVERITGNAILCGAPVERFSEKMPAVPPSVFQADLLPIDVLYGIYDATNLSIEIYFNRIQQDAPRFRASFEDFLQVVRLHEYAHAVVHLGIRSNKLLSTLNIVGTDGLTDWNVFIQRRTSSFHALDTVSHEFLAQAITYACLLKHIDFRVARLQEVFDNLMKKQPLQYIIPEDVKAVAANVDWSLLLEVARKEFEVSYGDNFSLYEGLVALTREFGSKREGTNSSWNEWAVEVDDVAAISDLKAELAANAQSPETNDERARFLVDRFAGLRVEVFAREHPPPHFRVKCGNESANYRLSDCFQLNGDLRGQYSVIRRWHARNMDKLIAAWNERRPSDCPVGNYRDEPKSTSSSQYRAPK